MFIKVCSKTNPSKINNSNLPPHSSDATCHVSRVHKRGSKLVNFEGYLQIKLTIKDFKNHFFLLLGLVQNDFHHKIQCIIFFVGKLKFRQYDL